MPVPQLFHSETDPLASTEVFENPSATAKGKLVTWAVPLPLLVFVTAI